MLQSFELQYLELAVQLRHAAPHTCKVEVDCSPHLRAILQTHTNKEHLTFVDSGGAFPHDVSSTQSGG